MVRTRGASSYRGEASFSRGEPSSSSHDKRRRPTPFARRRRVEEYRVDVIDEHDYEEWDEFIQHGHGEDDYVEQEDDYVEQEDVQQQDDSSEEELEAGGEDGGFPGGPHDTSLLTHYTQHVAFAIWQGRSWIYEHFPAMGRRKVFESYTDLDPRASRYIPLRVGWSLTEGRTYLDALTYDAVIWHPYIAWFRRVSHPYITPGDDNERPSLSLRMRRDLPDDRLVPSVRRRRSAELGLLGGIRRVIRMLQGMLTCRNVTEGTIAYQRTTETLQVARRFVEEYESSNRRGGRHVRGRASFS
ncbi:hypothetical protein LR48_Vigan05g136400 [Vigna angularis]|uniref:Aminotransferase-like plant mobile domain-containing protein n=1 Tax=Phaseolus angularis TaxID=3914 RepID=A0A0L9UMI3_PHAAN|nr:hypothetical protein LR48_Vigan05g136400 [Vigna angularis]